MKRLLLYAVIVLAITVRAYSESSQNWISVNLGQTASGLFLWADRELILPIEYQRSIGEKILLSFVATPRFDTVKDIRLSIGGKYRTHSFFSDNAKDSLQKRGSVYMGIYPIYNTSIAETLGHRRVNWNVMALAGNQLFSRSPLFFETSVGFMLQDCQELFSSGEALPFLVFGISAGLRF